MGTESISGHNKYYVLFLDDCTSLGHTYFLHHKNQATQAFREFKAWAETQTGHKITCVRSDRGTEFTSEDFTSVLKEYGIEHQKSTPDSPQQNGRAERWNRTIMEKALSMLHFAGLSHGFWQLAVGCAVHLYNRQPMRRFKWRTPITAWNGTVPDVSYFRVFGCKVFVHVQKDHRQKLEKKALEMTFVGYADGSKGYLFWNPAKRSLVVSRDVTFDENIFPARKEPGNHPVTPGDNPFPEFQDDDSSSDSSSDSGGSPSNEDLQIPLPDINDEPQPPPRPPTPPAQLQQPPPQPQPQPPPQPRRPRRRNEPVGEPRRSECQGAGRNPQWQKDNTEAEYGNNPAEVDAQTDDLGNRNADKLLSFYLDAAQYKPGVPRTRHEAMRSDKRHLWLGAEKVEYDSLIENKTWILVPRPKDKPVVSCRWVYDIKHDGRLKARLVARGFTQIWGENYHETFSPITRYESIRYLIAHAALEDWEMETMDIKTAFLNGDLEEEIYMEQPEGWAIKGKEDYICLLKKAIYGLKQASRQWNAKIHQSLLNLEFKRTYSDAGVYVYRRQRGDSVTIVVLYVDDLLLFGDSKNHIKQVKQTLGRQYKMTDLGPVHRFLGLRIRRDRSLCIIDIDQEDYIQSVLEHFEMADCKPANTPLPAGAELVKNDG